MGKGREGRRQGKAEKVRSGESAPINREGVIHSECQMWSDVFAVTLVEISTSRG